MVVDITQIELFFDRQTGRVLRRR